MTIYEFEVKVEGKVVDKGAYNDPFNAIAEARKHFIKFNYGDTTKLTIKVKNENRPTHH